MDMKKILEDFKKKIENGDPVYGPFMKTSDPAFVEIAGYAGFDFAILDMEHGPNSLQTMQNLVRAAIISGVLPVIRVRDRDPESISQALDIGALAIQVPQITNAQDVRDVISASKFSPEGKRGVCRFVRAANYSAIPGETYFKEANKALIIIQLEGKEAIQNFDEILRESGVDIYFIGPYDLSQALGLTGQIDHPEVKRTILDLVTRARKLNRTLGLFTDTVQAAIEWKKLGVGYISYSVDTGIFYSACLNILNQIK